MNNNNNEYKSNIVASEENMVTAFQPYSRDVIHLGYCTVLHVLDK